MVIGEETELKWDKKRDKMGKKNKEMKWRSSRLLGKESGEEPKVVQRRIEDK